MRLPALLLSVSVLLILAASADASTGDRLPEFRRCVAVRDTLPLPLYLLPIRNSTR